jgi:cupin domain
MNVIDIRGFTEDAIVGPQNGATRVFIWCTTVQAGHVVGLHKHLGEELSRVLYGRLRFRVGDQVQEIGAGEVVIVEPETIHGYVALEDTEIEVYGEIGSGIFIPVDGPYDGADFEEIFVRDVPWSRAPQDERQYITRAEQIERFRSSYTANPFA